MGLGLSLRSSQFCAAVESKEPPAKYRGLLQKVLCKQGGTNLAWRKSFSCWHTRHGTGSVSGAARTARAESVCPFSIPTKISFCKRWSIRLQLPAGLSSVWCLSNKSFRNHPLTALLRAQSKSCRVLPQSWKTAQSRVPQAPSSKKLFSARLESFKTCFMLLWPLGVEVSDRCASISQWMKLSNEYKNLKKKKPTNRNMARFWVLKISLGTLYLH